MCLDCIVEVGNGLDFVRMGGNSTDLVWQGLKDFTFYLFF